ncbi:conjugal transfer protein TraH [Rhodanobacter denitrificans]|uniref:conjugal transfer protein TraH n=1 Tax=Rhodanobacter denitrificans TaxID=666685 RepID=UPI001F46576C|nr:conjugal transfer protein TraH [Rhodanobacter denitrificans]UJJ60584.1 conjugal transfer protein TraH [Rhodanobacter denitrificans]
MRSLLLILLLSILTVTIGGLAPVAAQDIGVGKQSRNIFDSMTNTTDPKVVMGARRGVITGGSFVAKNRMMNVQLVSMNAPSVSVGCGGIDAFMGSFSFISKQQMVQALRSIASAAVGYAFKLALASMCPSCEKMMATMQDTMNALTSNNINSCEVGQALIQAGGDNSIASAIEKAGAPIRSRMGWADDYEASKNQGGSRTPMMDVLNKSPQIYSQVVSGNIVWQSLTAQGTGLWFGDDSHELLEDIISLTGTIIVCMPKNPGSSGPDCVVSKTGTETKDQDGRLVQRVIEPSLTLEELVDGSTGNKAIKRWTCAGQDTYDPKGCNDMVLKDYTNYVGMRQRVRDVFLGTGANSTGGMIDAMAMGDRTPTAMEKAFMSGGGAYTQMALNLAKKSPTAAKMFVQQFDDLIAAELVRNIVFVNIDAALSALSRRDGADTSEVRKLIGEAMDRNRAQLGEYYHRAQGRSAMFDYFSNLNSVVEKRDPIQRPIGSLN